jgi:hypothetical protein
MSHRMPLTTFAAYRKEGFKMAAPSRSVELVEQARRSESFPPRF